MIYGLPFHTQRFFRATMLDAFDITNTQLGDMFAAYGVTAMFSYFFGGPFADRYSARSLVVVSLVLTAFGGLYMATFPGVWQMSALYAFWGVTTSCLLWGALIKATRDWGGTASQGIAFGILDGGRGLAAAVFAAIAVGILALYLPTETALVTDLDRRAGLRSIILYYSLITLLSAGIVWFLVPHARDIVSRHRNPFAGVPEVMRRPLIWAQAGVIICAYCGYKGLDNYSLYAVQVLGMNEVDAARLAIWGAYMRPFAAIVAGLIADRFDAARSIGVAFVVLLLAYLPLASLTPETSGVNIIYANIFISFFAVFAIRGIYFALLEENRTPLHVTGAAVGMVSLIGYTPDIFFAAIAGRILDANPGVEGHHNYFLFSAAIMLIGLVAVAWLIWLRRQGVEKLWPAEIKA